MLMPVAQSSMPAELLELSRAGWLLYLLAATEPLTLTASLVPVGRPQLGLCGSLLQARVWRQQLPGLLSAHGA